MTPPLYTLTWILPFVRQALKGSGSLEYRRYVEKTLGQLGCGTGSGSRGETPASDVFRPNLYNMTKP